MNLKISLFLSLMLHIAIMPIIISTKHVIKPKKKIIQIQIKQKPIKLAKSKLKSSLKEELFVINELNKLLRDIGRINKEPDFIRKLTTSLYVAKNCKKFYVGIGVVHGPLFNKLQIVVPNSPADKAGLKVGDELFISGMRIRDVYPIGTLIHITFIRDGIMITVPMKVAKICTRDKT